MSNGVVTGGTLESRLAGAVDEFLSECRHGRPDIEDFAGRYPELADHLRQVLPALALLEPAALGPADAADDTTALTGTLGDFRLVREVGRGGMGIVYEAEQISLGRQVALKVLPYAATMDAKQLQRFRNEAKAAASLHHEHIVPVYAVGCERGVHYYAMQFIEGQSLAHLIPALHALPPSPPLRGRGAGGEGVDPALDSTGPYQPTADAPTQPLAALSTERSGPKGRDFYRTLAQLVAQAADALEHAHSLGIVHRDVKPGNLLVDATGKLWVADFGLARFGPDVGLTVSGDLLGTLRYMAPEQALARHGLVDHRADIYALGATLYELLTGRPAVDATERADVLRQIAFEEPTAPRKLDKSVPPELETITLKCLVKNPAERYATAGELADDLRRWLDHQTIKAKPPTLRQKAAKWAVRHTAVVRAAVAALAASALALAISTYIVWKKEVKVQAAYQRALNHLRTARQAADEMLTQAADRLFDVPRMETARLALLQQAVRIYDSFLMEYRDDPALRLEAGLAATRLGGINYDLGRHAEAEQAFRQSITLLQALAADSPADAECQRHLARSFRKFGSYLSDKDRAHRADAEHNLREAAGIWKRLVSAQPTDAHDQARLAETYGVLALAIARQEGRSQEGEDMYRNALGLIDRLPPDVGREPSVRWAYAETSRNLAGLLGARYKLPEEQETLTRRALKVYEERLAESGSPPSRAARDGMGFCYSNLGEMAFGRRELRESETLFRKAFDLYAQLANDFPHFEAYASRLFKRTQRLTDVLCLDGRDDEAEAVVRQFENLWQGLSAIHPDQQAHARGLVDCYLGLPANLVGAGRLAEAVSYYREAVRLKPDSYESHISLGNALSKRGLLDEATAVYREAIRLKPDSYETHNRLGIALNKEDLLDEAIAVYREAIRLKPNYEPTRYNLSLVLARKGLFGEAIAEGREAIRILPKHAGVHIQLARLLATCPDPVYRNPAQAVEVANRAVELTPANGNAWNAVGIARYHSGDWKGAIEALQKGNDLPNGGRGGDFFYLAMAHWQLGEKDQARQWYDKAVQWTDKNEPRNEGLRLYRTEAAALLGIADPPKTGDK